MIEDRNYLTFHLCKGEFLVLHALKNFLKYATHLTDLRQRDGLKLNSLY